MESHSGFLAGVGPESRGGVWGWVFQNTPGKKDQWCLKAVSALPATRVSGLGLQVSGLLSCWGCGLSGLFPVVGWARPGAVPVVRASVCSGAVRLSGL